MVLILALQEGFLENNPLCDALPKVAQASKRVQSKTTWAWSLELELSLRTWTKGKEQGMELSICRS